MYPNHRGLERRWLLLAALLAAGSARAHDADIIYVLLTDAAGGGLEEVVTLTAGTLSQLAPVDADADGALSQADLDARTAAINAGVWDQMTLEADVPCVRSGERAILRDGFVELVARFACAPGPLSQDFRILRVLTSNYRVVLGQQLDGEGGRDFAQGNVQKLILRPRPLQDSTGAAPELRFPGGLVSPLALPGLTLVLLLSWLLSASLWAAGARLGVLLAGLLTAGLLAPLWVPPALFTGIGAGLTGAGIALWVLARSPRALPVWSLGVLALVEGFSGGARTLGFQGGRLLALVGLAAVGVPIARIIGRRPALKRKLIVAVACLALAAFGFSLIQTARAF